MIIPPNETDPSKYGEIKIEKIISDASKAPELRIAEANAFAAEQNISLDQIDLLKRVQSASPTAVVTTDATVPSAEGEVIPEVTGEEIVVNGKRGYPDHRIRLSAFNGQEREVYGENDRTRNILAPLYATKGLVFPFTPSVSVSQDTSWQTADLEQVNYDILSYQKSSSATFSVSGKFSVQNQREGEYLLAALHFLRTVSKAYFGSQDVEQFVAPAADEGTDTQVERVRKEGKAGLPPPVLLFSGYGNMMFNDIRVVVKSHNWAFEETADLIRIDLPTGGEVWLPPLMNLSITLAMQQNTDRLRDEFKLDDFRTGELLNKKGWF